VSARYDVQILTIPAPSEVPSGTGLRDHRVKLPWMSHYDITAQQVCEETPRECGTAHTISRHGVQQNEFIKA